MEKKMIHVFNVMVVRPGRDADTAELQFINGGVSATFFCAQQAHHAAHAINNHDRLTEENKAIKADRDNAISNMSKSWQHNADDHPDLLSRFVDMANRQFDEKDALREALSNLHWQVTARASERHILEADEVEWAKQLLNKNKA